MANQNLKFASRSENIVLVEKLIDKVCDDFQLNEDFYGNILVAVTEAVNNAIYHGNKADPTKKVNVSFIPQDGKMLKFVISDEGEGFNYDSLPDPTDPANIEKINGRGVFLMKNLADDISFSENGNTVELLFNISENSRLESGVEA